MKMLTTGQLIGGRYEVGALLGQGGMGRVYRVRHQHLDRPFALKVADVAGPAAEAQFLAEARILAGLSHPALPRVTDFFTGPDGACLVMDEVPGDDLQARLDAGGPVPVAEALPWLLQLLDALAYVHAAGVVHRDVKPANLKLRPDGRLVLVDFGIAKAGHPAGVRAGGVPAATAFGARGAFTPHLAAPEQVMGQATGPRTDLYAAGATFAYLMTGALPPQPPPGPVGAVLARALAPEPGGRWADAAAMRRALAGLAGPGAASGAGPGGAPPAMPAGRRDIRRV